MSDKELLKILTNFVNESYEAGWHGCLDNKDSVVREIVDRIRNAMTVGWPCNEWADKTMPPGFSKHNLDYKMIGKCNENFMYFNEIANTSASNFKVYH